MFAISFSVAKINTATTRDRLSSQNALWTFVIVIPEYLVIFKQSLDLLGFHFVHNFSNCPFSSIFFKLNTYKSRNTLGFAS